MRPLSNSLGLVGGAVALPSFVLNWLSHGNTLPSEDLDRLDGVWSLMFMVGAGIVVAGIFLASQPPVGRKGRYLLWFEAIMVTLAAAWAGLLVIDPGIVEDPNVAVAIADSCWPLHQAFMVVVGITALRAKLWDSPSRFTLFGPAIGLLILGIGAASGVDFLAALGIGLGWAIAGVGVAMAKPQEANSQGTIAAVPAAAG